MHVKIELKRTNTHTLVKAQYAFYFFKTLKRILLVKTSSGGNVSVRLCVCLCVVKEVLLIGVSSPVVHSATRSNPSLLLLSAWPGGGGRQVNPWPFPLHSASPLSCPLYSYSGAHHPSLRFFICPSIRLVLTCVPSQVQGPSPAAIAEAKQTRPLAKHAKKGHLFSGQLRHSPIHHYGINLLRIVFIYCQRSVFQKII